MDKKVKNQFADDVNWFVPSDDRTEAYEVKGLNRTIYVSKEMKRELIREEWREWKHMTNAERCDIPSAYEGKMKKCRGNCSQCEHTRQNIFHSFDEFEQDVNEGKADPDEMVRICEEYNASDYEEPIYDLKPYYEFVKTLDKVGKKIIKVLLDDAETTPGRISKITSIPKTTVQRRLAAIKKAIKDRYNKNN